MKLISMTDYVLEQISINQFDEDFTSKVVNYAKFLKQPIKLGMFIPCDENDVPLDCPHNYGLLHLYPTGDFLMDASFKCALEYKQAKERVVFEGFELIKPSDKCYILFYKENTNCQFLLKSDFSFSLREYKDDEITEDLVQYNLTITDNAVKKYGL